jgi:cellulose biosynthesis protein BcsQ
MAPRRTFTLAVWSAQAGVGKTTLATSLAQAWAEAGLWVVLVDADPNGTATRLNRGDPNHGLYQRLQPVITGGVLATAGPAEVPVHAPRSCGQFHVLAGHPGMKTWDGHLIRAEQRSCLGDRVPGAPFAAIRSAATEATDIIVIDVPAGTTAWGLGLLLSADGVLCTAPPTVAACRALELFQQQLPGFLRQRMSMVRTSKDSPYPVLDKRPRFLGMVISDHLPTGTPLETLWITAQLQSIGRQLAWTMQREECQRPILGVIPCFPGLLRASHTRCESFVSLAASGDYPAPVDGDSLTATEITRVYAQVALTLAEIMRTVPLA